MVTRKQKIDIIIAHSEDLKWFQDDIATLEAAKDLRTRRAAAMSAREVEWNGLPPKQREVMINKIRAEVEEEVQ